jgi:hypothetical protein
MKSFSITIFFLCFSVLGFCGSDQAIYKFLNLPNSAEVSALGGVNVSLQNKDVNLVYQNPALLSGSVHKNLALNYTSYIGDIGYGSIAYAQNIDSVSHWAASLSYMNYGSSEGYDWLEVPTGDYYAGDFCLNLTYSRRLSKNIVSGITLKPIYSQIETYHSFGLAVDVGGNYYDPEHDFSVGLALKNVGVQFKDYYSDSSRSLPWDIQLGVTKRLAHAPFRFSLTYVHLNQWNLDYYRMPLQNSNTLLLTDANRKIGWGDMLFRHLIIGAEFIPSNNFNLAIAYNHRRSQEYALENTKSINGFSFGAGIRVYKFALGVAYAQYAASGNTLSLSIATSLDSSK